MTAKKEAKDPEVVTFIGLIEWNEKAEKVKAKRGKRLALKVKSGVGYEEFLNKAEDKWRAYQSDLFHKDKECIPCYEDGQRANFLPGISEKFSLKRYREEKGQDYNRITLYLCSKSDSTHFVKDVISLSDDDFDDGFEFPAFEIKKKEVGEDKVQNQQFDFKLDESVEEKLHPESNEKAVSELQRNQNEDCTFAEHNTEIKVTIKNVQDVFKHLSSKVDHSKDLFFTVRRGADVFRVLSPWQRQVKLGNPERVIRIHYLGEYGIDSGAMATEFFSDLILDIGKQMFPCGSPSPSTLHVKNGNFKAFGQLAAASIAQGGPAPTFLAECVYQ